ncbi:hypothetical protein [Streptomyces deccanensis]|uniref:hypothetical protein n=1 Tax=Streptomyces deccanensis TaxID=424188 RepID=UPI003B8469F2
MSDGGGHRTMVAAGGRRCQRDFRLTRRGNLSAHQLGAGASAFLGATARDLFGAYDVVWTSLGAVCLAASLLAVVVRGPRGARRTEAQ